MFYQLDKINPFEWNYRWLSFFGSRGIRFSGAMPLICCYNFVILKKIWLTWNFTRMLCEAYHDLTLLLALFSMQNKICVKLIWHSYLGHCAICTFLVYSLNLCCLLFQILMHKYPFTDRPTSIFIWTHLDSFGFIWTHFDSFRPISLYADTPKDSDLSLRPRPPRIQEVRCNWPLISGAKMLSSCYWQYN